MTRFVAVWPITDPTVPIAELLSEARADIRAVALRHGHRVRAIGAPAIREGRHVPGSGGAALVVTCAAEIEERVAA